MQELRLAIAAHHCWARCPARRTLPERKPWTVGTGLGYFVLPVTSTNLPWLCRIYTSQQADGMAIKFDVVLQDGKGLTNDCADLQAGPNRDAVGDREDEGVGIGL
jgi:hypothetical protein